DFHVTGVQTCALPIWAARTSPGRVARAAVAGADAVGGGLGDGAFTGEAVDHVRALPLDAGEGAGGEAGELGVDLAEGVLDDGEGGVHGGEADAACFELRVVLDRVEDSFALEHDPFDGAGDVAAGDGFEACATGG